MIDKEIRLQLRQQKQAVQTDENPGSSSQTVKKTQKDLNSYTEWIRRKKFEEKYKHALMMRALKNKYEKELLQKQEEEEKKSENFKKIKKWEHQKISQNVRKKKNLKYSKHEIEMKKEQQKRDAEDNYKEWLRKNMLKLKEEKRKNRLEKQKEAQEQKLKEEKAEELKKKTQENFRKWLKDKKKFRKNRKSKVKTQIKLKKPIMLAYSPNRKLANDNGSYHDLSSGEMEESSTSENNYVRKVSAKPNLFNNFNDLSSSGVNDKNEEFSDKFNSESDEEGKVVHDSFQGDDSEYEEEYEEESEEYDGSYASSSVYEEEESNDKANNSY